MQVEIESVLRHLNGGLDVAIMLNAKKREESEFIESEVG